MVYVASYALGIPINQRSRFRTFKGYLHAKYERFLLCNESLSQRFATEILRLIIDQYFISVRKPGQKLLILCQTKNFVLHLVQLLGEVYPSLKPVAYFSGNSTYGKARRLEQPVIVSTIKSCSTGIDIKGLKTCINTVSFASEPQAIQCFGRLRQIPGEDTLYIDLYNREISSHCSHVGNRITVYTDRARSVNEIRL